MSIAGCAYGNRLLAKLRTISPTDTGTQQDAASAPSVYIEWSKTNVDADAAAIAMALTLDVQEMLALLPMSE